MKHVHNIGGQSGHIQEFPQQNYRTLTVSEMEPLGTLVGAWDTVHVSPGSTATRARVPLWSRERCARVAIARRFRRRPAAAGNLGKTEKSWPGNNS